MYFRSNSVNSNGSFSENSQIKLLRWRFCDNCFVSFTSQGSVLPQSVFIQLHLHPVDTASNQTKQKVKQQPCVDRLATCVLVPEIKKSVKKEKIITRELLLQVLFHQRWRLGVVILFVG